MRVTYNWLKDFVDVKLSPDKLAEKLTMAGLSVAALEQVGYDWVYDIEVTSNRPDWLSVRGIAHEVAAITGGKIKKSQVASHKSQVKSKKNLEFGIWNLGRLSINIEDKHACKSYYGNLITGVKVGPSPEWLKKRLEAVGIRPINNVVDITNYCLMEHGQPLHAFDYDKLLQSTIIVRRAKKDEMLVLIDGSQKKLSENILVVADSANPVAIAGIMGGRDSEVSSLTTNVMLESACFDPVVVRRGARFLGIASDSSYRFERGVELANVKAGLEAATSMIVDLCGATLAVAKHSGAKLVETKKKISLNICEVCDILGLDLTLAAIKQILEPLGFGVVKKTSASFDAIVPFYRKDVSIAVDVIEEIARIYGYDRIPLTVAEAKPFVFKTSLSQALELKLKKLLSSLGLKEAITHSLTAREDYEKSCIALPEEALSLENPLSNDFQIVRPSLLPSLLNCAASNINHSQKDLELFEVAHVFSAQGSNVLESTNLGLILCGARRESWQKESRPYTFYDLKGIIETMLDALKIEDVAFVPIADLGLAVENSAVEIRSGEKKLGILAQVSDKVKRNWGIKTKDAIFVSEFSIEALAGVANLKHNFRSIVSIPSITRDISIVAGPQVSFERIKAIVRREAKEYIQNIVFSECYQGKEIPADSLGLTISVEYGSLEKTLTDAAINPVHTRVLEALVKELTVKLR